MVMSNEVKLGAPKYEQGNKNYFSFKKDQNSFTLRILPPMGELAEKGKWSVYHRVEFGHVGTDGKMKPFLSPRVVNYDGMVEVESESHTRRELLKQQQETAKKAGNAQLVEQCTNLLRKYNQDAKHYMNAVDLQGNVGLFKIGHRGYQALKAEIERLRSEGVDPVGIDNGRYFVFSRSGKGRDTVYTVTEYKQKQTIDGPQGKMVVDVPYPHSIDETIMGKLATDAFELNKVYPAITAEEESRIIAEGATAVDAILGKKAQGNPASTTNTETNTSVEAQTLTPPSLPENGPVETAVDTTVPQTGTPVETTTTTTTPTLETTTTANTGGNLENISEEDFFKNIQNGNF
jgi:hypothetical protein